MCVTAVVLIKNINPPNCRKEEDVPSNSFSRNIDDGTVMEIFRMDEI